MVVRRLAVAVFDSLGPRMRLFLPDSAAAERTPGEEEGTDCREDGKPAEAGGEEQYAERDQDQGGKNDDVGASHIVGMCNGRARKRAR